MKYNNMNNNNRVMIKYFQLLRSIHKQGQVTNNQRRQLKEDYARDNLGLIMHIYFTYSRKLFPLFCVFKQHIIHNYERMDAIDYRLRKHWYLCYNPCRLFNLDLFHGPRNVNMQNKGNISIPLFDGKTHIIVNKRNGK